jgi:hypothetical protein
MADLASNDAELSTRSHSNVIWLKRLRINQTPDIGSLVFRKCHVVAGLIADDRDALVDAAFGTGAFGGIVVTT